MTLKKLGQLFKPFNHDCAPLKFFPLVYIWISVKFWEEYRYFYSHLAVKTRDISKPIRLYTNKSHVDLPINLPFTVLQYWQEADERIDKPLTTSNNREYPLLLSGQGMLSIIKRLQISTLLDQNILKLVKEYFSLLITDYLSFWSYHVYLVI